LAVLINLPANLGYWALALFVGVETMGIPVPGETALIAASLLAAQGKLDIVFVIAIAAGAAIIGDNFGFVVGRKLGRRVVEWEGGPYPEKRRELLDRGQVFFDRHGGKAVFLGRWVAGLRITAAWLAGINKMPWRRFFFWNALGGIAWATTVGLTVTSWAARPRAPSARSAWARSGSAPRSCSATRCTRSCGAGGA